MEQDITNKIKAVKIVERTFTPEGGQPMQYRRLALEIVVNGNVRQMIVRPSPDQLLVLETLPEDEATDFLKQSTINPINQ